MSSPPIVIMCSFDLPIDVSNIENLTEIARHFGVCANELRLDASLAQIGAHGKVCNCCNHGDGCGNVMEDSMGTRLGVRHSDEDDC